MFMSENIFILNLNVVFLFISHLNERFSFFEISFFNFQSFLLVVRANHMNLDLIPLVPLVHISALALVDVDNFLLVRPMNQQQRQGNSEALSSSGQKIQSVIDQL